MKNEDEPKIIEDCISASVQEIKKTERISKNVQNMSVEELTSLKDELVSSIQAVSLRLGQLLQERHALREEVAGRDVTIGQLLRVQDSRLALLGAPPAVQM